MMQLLQVLLLCLWTFKRASGLTLPALAARSNVLSTGSTTRSPVWDSKYKLMTYCPKVHREKSHRRQPPHEDDMEAVLERTKNQHAGLSGGYGDEKPQAAYLVAKKGAEYQFTCHMSGVTRHIVEWKTEKRSSEDNVEDFNISNILAFGNAHFDDSSRPWYYSNVLTSQYCMPYGNYQCDYLFVGYYEGEIWQDYMSMHMITDRNHEERAPVVREICRYVHPDGQHGTPHASDCSIEHIQMYVPIENP